MLFTCDVCSKVFTEKRALMRHIASVHNSESYDCILCKKLFKREDCLRRHQLSIHSRTYEVSCSKCEKKFTRADNMRRHKKTCCVCRQCSKNFETIKEWKEHNCTNLSDKEAVPTNKPVSSLEEGSKTASFSSEALSKKKYLKIKLRSHSEAATCPAAKKPKHDILENEQMDKTDADMKNFTRKNWSSIRIFSKKNKVQNIFNFLLQQGFERNYSKNFGNNHERTEKLF